MPRKKRLQEPKVISVIIEERQHTALRQLAHDRRTSMAALVREAIDQYLAQSSDLTISVAVSKELMEQVKVLAQQEKTTPEIILKQALDLLIGSRQEKRG